MTLNVGVDCINSIADSDTIQDTMDFSVNSTESYVSGVAYHVVYAPGPFKFIAEYVSADEFKSSEMDFNGKGATPKAFNTELAYTHPFTHSTMIFALAYQGTEEALALGFPETKWLLGVT